MKAAHVLATDMASTFKRAATILPHPEDGSHGARAAGMFFLDDTLFRLRKVDPVGERVARVSGDRNILLVIRDPCAVRRTVADGTLERRAGCDVPPTGMVAGVQAGCFPRPFAALASNAPDFATTL